MHVDRYNRNRVTFNAHNVHMPLFVAAEDLAKKYNIGWGVTEERKRKGGEGGQRGHGKRQMAMAKSK